MTRLKVWVSMPAFLN